MNKFMSVLQTKVIPKANKTASEKYLSAFGDTMVSAIPFIIISSIFLILADFPIPAYLSFLKAHPQIQQALLYPCSATFNIAALIVTFGMGYKLGESYKVDGISSGLISLAAYFLVIPTNTVKIANDPATVINASYLSSAGLSMGLIMAIISTEVYHFIVKKGIITKMPDDVPPAAARSSNSIIPRFFTVIVIWIIRLIVEITPYKNVQNLIQSITAQPSTKLGTSFWGTLAVFLVVNLLWRIGLHESITANSAMLPIWLSLTSQNAVALAAGHAAKNIASAEPRYVIFVGGSGATLGLVTTIALFAESQRYRKLGRLSLAPSIFNINEPVLFGFPIVFNPIMWIPFLLIPIITVTITYLSMQFGTVGRPIGVLPPGTTPMIIGDYIIAGGISGAILQIVIFIISFFVYYPLFKIEDNLQYKKEMEGDTKKQLCLMIY